ncbi:MAG: hypothetical protein K2J30_04340, partial [Clostridia bacterium]|nr:hypothetical protein [Clostridia bacterium]
MRCNMQQLAWLSEKLVAAYGQELTDRIFQGYFVKRPVTLRVNSLKSDHAKVREAFSLAGISLTEVPWYSDAFLCKGTSEREIERLSVYQ